jgi:energy-coupling factor transporter ATP-binding protein EcfA2
MNKVDKETRKVFIDEMARTRGWEILQCELLDKRKRDISRLVNGRPSNIDLNDVIVSRARIKLIDEILESVLDGKEEKQ